MSFAEPSFSPKAEPDIKTINQERAKEYQEFLKYVAQSTGHFSYAQLAVIWPAVCQSAMQWILVEHKSVDFGFVVLHPSPLRQNWKSLLVGQFPQLGSSLLGKSKTLKQGLMEGVGFFAQFFSAQMLALARERYLVWGVETELKKSWWRAMLRLEDHKFNKLGSVEYSSYVARQIQKLRPKLVRVYLSFLRQVSYPCGAIRRSRAYGRGFLVPFVPKKRVYPVAISDDSSNPVVSRDPDRPAPPKFTDSFSPSPGLPQVQDIRSLDEDLRITTDDKTT